MRIFNRRAQNLMEYTLLMAGAVALSIVALRQGGMVDKTFNKSLEITVDGVECMALNTCYDPDGCPAVCGNGCCEAHAETAGSCWADCECSNPLECDDGIYCNGVEECGGNLHCRHGVSLGAGKDAGLCVACDGSGGELAVLDDPECGSIDCSGHNYFHHAATTADATDVETCYLRKYDPIDLDRCDGIRKCKEPTGENCTASADKPQYSCDTCKYIAAGDCTGLNKGGCSSSPKSSECGTRVCDLLDVSCRDYHDVTRYCDGGGSCGTPECNSFTNKDKLTVCGTEDCDYLDTVTACRDYHDVTKYCDGVGGCATPACSSFTNAAAGTIVKLCTECDGGGGERAAPDDNDCGVIACSALSYYEQIGTESPVDTEICNYYEYTNMLTDRCEDMNDCKDVGVVGATDCVVPAPTQPYICGTCLYIAPGDCDLKNKGGCTPYPAETRTDICRVCDGTIAGGEKMPAPGHNETGCGTGGNIDCDGKDGYYASGTKSATATEYCDYRNYTDITSDQCGGIGKCKDQNSLSCQDHTVTPQLTCGTCQKLKGGTCTSDTDVPGECENYPSTEYTAICTVCSGTGPTTKAAAGDAKCGIIECTKLPSTYSTTSTNSAATEEVCKEQRYQTSISTDNNCKPVGDGTTGACKEVNTADCVPTTYQTTCKACEYLTGCNGTTPGSCSPYAVGTSCGGSDVCDGNGVCRPPCGDPVASNYPNATVSIGGNSYNDERTVTCKDCYSGTPNSTTIKCVAGGIWSGSGPSCSIKTCASPATATTDVTSGSNDCGATRTVSCKSGYTGSSTNVTCNSDGTWSGSMPSCTPNGCGAPPTVLNATVNDNSSGSHGDVRTFTCISGCAGGSNKITCDFGNWVWNNNTALTCSGIDGSWSAWGACSSCQQTRTCSATCGGGGCPGSDTQSCYSGTWSTGDWIACSATCGGGTQTRSVTCSNSCCDPNTKPAESQQCNTQACTWHLEYGPTPCYSQCAPTIQCTSPLPVVGNTCTPGGTNTQWFGGCIVCTTSGCSNGYYRKTKYECY